MLVVNRRLIFMLDLSVEAVYSSISFTYAVDGLLVGCWTLIHRVFKLSL
jgi:hypothetical protein